MNPSDLLSEHLAVDELVSSFEPARSEMAALQKGLDELELDQVLNIAMDTVIEVTHAQRGFLMLTHPESGELEFQVARNLDRETIASPAFEVSRSVIRRVAEEKQAILTADALTDPRFSDKESIWLRQLRSILCVPLTLKGRVTGVVYVENRLREG